MASHSIGLHRHGKPIASLRMCVARAADVGVGAWANKKARQLRRALKVQPRYCASCHREARTLSAQDPNAVNPKRASWRDGFAALLGAPCASSICPGATQVGVIACWASQLVDREVPSAAPSASSANLRSKDEARRIVANVAKLPELVRPLN
jgi:hypothetical protein